MALHLKTLCHLTCGFAALLPEVQEKAFADFLYQRKRRDDTFYTLCGARYYAALNETGRFTFMLASEY